MVYLLQDIIEGRALLDFNDLCHMYDLPSR